MAATLNAAAASAEAANDGMGVIILRGAAAMIQNGLTVSAANNVVFSLDGATAIGTPAVLAAGNGWAFGVEMGQMQGQLPSLEVGVFEGAIIISGPDIAYGFGLVQKTAGFTGASFGEIWQGGAGWAATALTGFGVADSIVGGSCTGGVPSGLGIVDCTKASLRSPGFNITASQPIAFPGNTATGSRAMAFAPARLRGASVAVDCEQTTHC